MNAQVRTLLMLLPVCLLLPTAGYAGVTRQDDGDNLAPTGKGWGEYRPPAKRPAKAVSGSSSSNGIIYHNGPLILGATNIYYIWYGNWSSNTATTLLPNLASTLGGSPYYNINSTYFNTVKQNVANAVRFAGQAFDPAYSLGKALTDANIQAIVSKQLSSGALPKDPNAVYFVLTSADVNETSGFCTQYCGWHTHASILSTDIKYAFVGNPDRCPSACEAQSTSPNGNPGADGMASIIAHELEESVTDPDLNAWYDKKGAENADKCAWTYGKAYAVGNGAAANMNLGGADYLIQQNWVNAGGGYCAISLP